MPAAAIAGVRPAPITPLPNTIDETGRIAKAADGSIRGSAPRSIGRTSGQARSSGDVLPES